MEISSKLKTYQVRFESDYSFFRELINIQNAIFVVDANVYRLYHRHLEAIPPTRLIRVDAIEENKTIDTALSICEKIIGLSAKRNTVLVSVGGGIIQDITGFVANIIYRGIEWIFVPTTLLAACDSCIGGKTSLNYKGYKNLLGTFYPPDMIHICSEMFKTLTERDFESGLGEVIKFNIMAGSEGLNNVEKNINRLLVRETGTIDRFVQSSLEFKKKFIEEDEFDRGERIKLNFAHTFGHAIEVVTAYKVPHGTAVAIGMLMANSISLCRNYISEDIVNRCEKALLPIIHIDIKLLEKPIDDYLKAIHKDKKQIGDSLTAVLIRKYDPESELEIVHDVTNEEIADAVSYFIGLYCASNSEVKK